MSAKPEKENCKGLFYNDPFYHSWLAIESRENGKYKVILPERKSPMTISNIEDLLNWFNEVFPNTIDIVKVTEVPYE